MFIEDIYERYVFARWCYLMGETYLSDIEYDKLEKEFKSKYPDDIHSKQPWSFDECPVEILKKYNRTDLIKNLIMGYQAESIYSINTWDELKSSLGGLNEDSRLSFKIDGWNTRADYYNGNLIKFSTRGRSGANKSAYSISKLVPRTIPIMGRVSITGETNIPHSKWPAYKLISGTNDQRASVSSAIANGAYDSLEFLAFNMFAEDKPIEPSIAYSKLVEMGFKTPGFVKVHNYETLLKGIEFMSKRYNSYDYLVDGLVLENSSMQYAIRLGAWEEKYSASYVIGYEQKQGLYGVSMVLRIKPVYVGTKLCKNVAVTNIANIVENNLSIGSPVAFNIRSGATVVLDISNTYQLQERYKNHYDDFINKVDMENK